MKLFTHVVWHNISNYKGNQKLKPRDIYIQQILHNAFTILLNIQTNERELTSGKITRFTFHSSEIWSLATQFFSYVSCPGFVLMI